MKGILIIGHGSKSAEAVLQFSQIVDLVRSKSPAACVEGAHMELAEPGIPEMVVKMVNAGVTSIVAVPYFLYLGNHIKQDIPELLATEEKRHPQVTFTLAKPIGVEPLLADILVKRYEETL